MKLGSKLMMSRHVDLGDSVQFNLIEKLVCQFNYKSTEYAYDVKLATIQHIHACFELNWERRSEKYSKSFQ